MILITGATETDGIEVAKLLSCSGQSFREPVRSRERADTLTAACNMSADFDDVLLPLRKRKANPPPPLRWALVGRIA